jgi:hypothetical protein
MKAHALTTSAPDGEEAMTIGSNGISTTDGDYTLDASYTQERAASQDTGNTGNTGGNTNIATPSHK